MKSIMTGSMNPIRNRNRFDAIGPIGLAESKDPKRETKPPIIKPTTLQERHSTGLSIPSIQLMIPFINPITKQAMAILCVSMAFVSKLCACKITGITHKINSIENFNIFFMALVFFVCVIIIHIL